MKCLQEPSTTWKKILQNIQQSITPSTISTDGIDIFSWKTPILVKGQTVEADFALWDFAGQDIYYTTHQFFLTQRALYLLVWDQTKPEEVSKVEFWLEVCHLIFFSFPGRYYY
jgi:internalin A